jgi:hypothetical protein
MPGAKRLLPAGQKTDFPNSLYGILKPGSKEEAREPAMIPHGYIINLN